MQTELFEMTSTSEIQDPTPVSQPSFLEKTIITLRLDQAIGFFLVMLIFYVLAFSWGVEKGKRAVQSQMTAQAKIISTSPVVEIPTSPKVRSEISAAQPSVASAVVSSSPAKEASVIPVAELPKPVAAVPEKPAGKYTVQHVTYLTQEAADREVQRLKKAGQTAFAVPTGKHFVVCIASFQTRQEATQFLKQLKTQRIVSLDAYVRSIPS